MQFSLRRSPSADGEKAVQVRRSPARRFLRSRFREHSLLDYWLSSVLFGIYGLRPPHLKAAAARIINPLSYPRLTEFQLAFRLLGPLAGKRVLDVGSPKLPALLLARRGEQVLYATDIRDYFIGPTRHLLEHAGLGHRIPDRIQLKVEDARNLSFADASFDAIYSISVIEHIPDEGDSAAMAELGRVLTPGGTVVITVPYSPQGYREDWVRGDVYERSSTGGKVFYQRHYDDSSIRSRLVAPSGLHLANLVYFGEPKIRVERLWNRIPMGVKLPLLWAQPFVARCLFGPISPEQKNRACGVAIMFTKPGPCEASEPDVGVLEDRRGEGLISTREKAYNTVQRGVRRT